MPTFSTLNHALQFGTNDPTVSIYGTDTSGYIVYQMSGSFYRFESNTKYFALKIIFDTVHAAIPASITITPANSFTEQTLTAQPSAGFFVDGGDFPGASNSDITDSYFIISGISNSTPLLGPQTLTWYYEVSGIQPVLPSGGADGQVIRQVSSLPAWSNDRVPDPSIQIDGKVLKTLGGSTVWGTQQSGPSPPGGTDGQVIRRVAGEPAWSDERTPDPSGESDGKVLTVASGAAVWSNPSAAVTTDQVIDSPSDSAPTNGSSNHQRAITFFGINEVSVPAGKTKFRLRAVIQGNGNSAFLMMGAVTPIDSGFVTPALGSDGYYTANVNELYAAVVMAMNFYDFVSGTGFAISAGDFKATVTFEWQ